MPVAANAATGRISGRPIIGKGGGHEEGQTHVVVFQRKHPSSVNSQRRDGPRLPSCTRYHDKQQAGLDGSQGGVAPTSHEWNEDGQDVDGDGGRGAIHRTGTSADGGSVVEVIPSSGRRPSPRVVEDSHKITNDSKPFSVSHGHELWRKQTIGCASRGKGSLQPPNSLLPLSVCAVISIPAIAGAPRSHLNSVAPGHAQNQPPCCDKQQRRP